MYVHREMLQTAKHRSANFGRHVRMDKENSQPNFEIVYILDGHFQGQRFKSRTMRSSFMIVLQGVTDHADRTKYIDIAKKL